MAKMHILDATLHKKKGEPNFSSFTNMKTKILTTPYTTSTS